MAPLLMSLARDDEASEYMRGQVGTSFMDEEGTYSSFGGFVKGAWSAWRRRPGRRQESKNVRISFAKLPIPSSAFIGDRNLGREQELALTGTEYVPTALFRLPFFEDADPAEADTALNHVYAGTMARTLSQVGGHPVDTVKTRLQVHDPPHELMKWRKKISKKAIGIGPVDIDNWFFKGPADLYQGVTGAFLGTVPNAFLYFVAYESSKKKLEKYLPPGLTHVASASIGTVVASVVRVPADTLKHRVQAYMHGNVFEAFKSIVTTDGIGGLYRGFWPTLMRDVPEIVIQFSVYENLRRFLQSKRKVNKLTTPEHLVLGAVAGAVAATCTMPLDLVKTRQQCGMSVSVHRVALAVVEENGVRGLFAGLGARAFHVSLMSALFFGLFEYCKLVLKPDRTPSDKLFIPKIWNKRRDKIWKRQFVYTE